jgi:alcohol dehydrogenase class IV
MNLTNADPDRGFRFDYRPGEIRCGRGCVDALGELLAARGLERALVVTGSTVGANRAVVGPVEAGLGDHLVEMFDETTTEKHLRTGLDGVERARAAGIDALVAVGGGSSLDVAKVIAALDSYGDPAAAAERAVESGSIAVAADADPLPIVAVPTTLAGADLSVEAGVNLSVDPDRVATHEAPNGSLSDERLMPTALCYDPALFQTTPTAVLTASAMNGFDKAVECLYSPHATPVTDATATEAIGRMQSGFSTLPEESMDERDLYDAVVGIVLAQYGISTPGRVRLSIVHAFGHGFSHDYDVHQGVVHGVLAPHVLEYVFERVDGRRHRLAAALGVDDAADPAAAVVDAVADVAADLDLPSRLRGIDGLDRAHLPAIAETIHGDGLMTATPPGVDPSPEEIRSILESAW